jgi:hypothetical protein
MSNSPLFKRAFVRGLNAQLIREGVVVYPSKEAADASADYIADKSGMPDPYFNGEQLDIKVASYLCDNLIKAAEYQCEQAGNQYSPVVTKTAQETTPVAVAGADAWALMQKSAAETGSLIQGGDAPNDLPAAASDNAEAALEAQRRPENYANLGEQGVGNWSGKGEGTVGTEQRAPEGPGATDSGSNSVTEQTAKSGSFQDIIRRVARKHAADTGSLITGGGNPNDLPSAAVDNAEAAQELNRRPEGYASMGVRGVGGTDFDIPQGAVVGRESPHPLSPGATDSGSNSLIDQTKNAFDRLFTQTAEKVVPYLPERMPENQKVAHVRAMMGLDVPERAGYLETLYASMGSKKEAAASVRDHFRKSAEAECETPMHEKSESKAEEKAEDKGPALPAFMQKKEEESKTGSLSVLHSRLKNLNA